MFLKESRESSIIHPGSISLVNDFNDITFLGDRLGKSRFHSELSLSLSLLASQQPNKWSSDTLQSFGLEIGMSRLIVMNVSF